MLRRLFGALTVVAIGVLASSVPASAGGGYMLFGDAVRVHPGSSLHSAIQLQSAGSGFGGIDFDVPAGLTFSQVQTLATDFQFTAGSCGGGAPRFQINVDGKNAFVYVAPPPNYTGCSQNVWQGTGNLVSPTSFVDTSQLTGGTFYDTFAAAGVKYGSDAVTGIQLVTDAGWMFGTQTVLVDNVTINDRTFTFEGRGHGGDDEVDD